MCESVIDIVGGDLEKYKRNDLNGPVTLTLA